jgi:hypothetical protein
LLKKYKNFLKQQEQVGADADGALLRIDQLHPGVRPVGLTIVSTNKTKVVEEAPVVTGAIDFG